jgi:hypothetical protein
MSTGPTVTLSQAAINDMIAYVQSPGASFTVTYNDADPSTTVSVAIDVKSTKGSVTTDRTQYPIGPSNLYVDVTDVDLNLDPTAADDAAQPYTVTGLGTPPTLQNLIEAGPNSGVFSNSYGTAISMTGAAGEVGVVTYTDAAAPDGGGSRFTSFSITPHTGVIAFDQTTYIIKNWPTITLTDPDLNTDVFSKQSTPDNNDNILDAGEVACFTSAATTGNIFDISLTETGDNTGVLEANFGLTFGATVTTPGSERLQMGADDIITAQYSDAADITGVASTESTTAVTKTNSGTVAWDADEYEGTTSVAELLVTDPDLDTSGSTIQSMPRDTTWPTPALTDLDIGAAAVKSSAGTWQGLLLRETTADSSIFSGQVIFTTGAEVPGNIPTIKVNAAGSTTLTGYYRDQLDVAGSTITRSSGSTFKIPVTVSGTISLDQNAYSPGDIASAANPGEWLEITVNDPDLDTSSSTVQSYLATTGFTTGTANNGRTWYTVTRVGALVYNQGLPIAETAANTGIFTARHQLTAAVLKGDVVTANYADLNDAAGNPVGVSSSANVITYTGQLSLDMAKYTVGDDIIVTLNEPDGNLNDLQIETVPAGAVLGTAFGTSTQVGEVWAKSETDSVGCVVQLDETETDTGHFEGKLSFTQTGTSSAGTLRVTKGDTVTLRYRDRLNAAGVAESVEAATTVSATTGVVELDKSMYTPTGTMVITITDADMNENPTAVNSIPASNVNIKSTTMTASANPPNALTETGINTGVFDTEVTLGSGNFAAAAAGDGLTVIYNDPVTESGSTNVNIVATASVDSPTAVLEFDQPTYLLADTVTITMTDPDANTNINLIESAGVTVYSTTDPGGMTLTCQETDFDTGIFRGSLTLSETQTAGSQLRAAIGDTLTATYTDNTANTGDIPGWTPGIGTILRIVDTARVVSTTPTIPGLVIQSTTPALLDQSGNPISKAKAGVPSQISAELTNSDPADQSMLYIAQVKDSAGRVVSLSHISGTIPGGATYTFGVPWTPSTPGSYTAEVFAWNSWTDPSPLSEVSTATITAD